MESPAVVVLCDPDSPEQARSQALAERLQLPLIQNVDRDDAPDFALCYAPDLQLRQFGRGAPGPISVNFALGKSDHRRRQGGGEAIVRAVAGKGSRAVSVVDLTAGLGGDAFVLASNGCSVTAVERSPIVHALLEDGWQRGMGESELAPILARLSVVAAESRDYLAQLQQNPPDAIYLDPMFPESRKSAQVKKEMKAFHSLVGIDPDSDQLLPLAMECAQYRVVVKRPLRAPYLDNREPTVSHKGKAIRFDIYARKRYPD